MATFTRTSRRAGLVAVAVLAVGLLAPFDTLSSQEQRALGVALPAAEDHWYGEQLRLAAADLDPVASTFSTGLATTVAFLPYQAAPFMVALGFETLRPATWRWACP